MELMKLTSVMKLTSILTLTGIFANLILLIQYGKEGFIAFVITTIIYLITFGYSLRECAKQ